MAPDSILFVISQYSLSTSMLRRIEAGLARSLDVPSTLLRMEDHQASLPGALDTLVASGHRSILVQPVGLPFPEGMRKWLAGALGNWLERQSRSDLAIALGPDVSLEPDLLELWAKKAIGATDATAIVTTNTALGKPGWTDPPDFTHHVLVCTGPRCQYRDAPSLIATLKTAVASRGHSGKCLITRTGCMFPCNKGPLVAVYPRGEWYRLETTDDVSDFVETVIAHDRTLPDRLVYKTSAAKTPMELA